MASDSIVAESPVFIFNQGCLIAAELLHGQSAP